MSNRQAEESDQAQNKPKFSLDYSNFYGIDAGTAVLDPKAPPFKCRNCEHEQLVPMGSLPGTEMQCKSCLNYGPYEPPRIMGNQNFDPLGNSNRGGQQSS